ncbi:hypothetical protein BVY01_01640, partial [bacterium I07]
ITIDSYDGIARIGPFPYNVGWRDILIDLDSGENTQARVYFPSLTTGENEPIVSPCQNQSYPAVVYTHGLRNLDYDLCDWNDPSLKQDKTHDYLQAEGLLKSLAASGIIAISFNWHGHFKTGHYNLDLSPLVVKAVKRLGELFGSGVNLQIVGLAGHSTGGAAVLYAADLFRNMSPPSAVINAVGLISPAAIFHNEQLLEPMLVIHGTREHSCMVGTSPLNIYCKAKGSKHLVVVEGANHFGYTDGICLDPDQQRISECLSNDPWHLLPEDDGYDNGSEVGGLTGQAAHKLQQRTARNYLHAFFSYYLQGNTSTAQYLIQKEGESCGHPEDGQQCDLQRLDVYMWWPEISDNVCGRAQVEISTLINNNPTVL